jgi:glutathione S-transferase
MSNEITTNDVVADSADQPVCDKVVDRSADMKCTQYVDFDKLYACDNVRGQLVTQIPQMVASLRTSRFIPNHPLVVSKKPDGRFLVLRGNRRFGGLTHIAEHHADEFGRILPRGKVPCLVHTDLTDREEILIRLDHSKSEDRVGLDDWSLFLAVKQLMRAEPDATEERIAEKLGLMHEKGKNAGKPNRSKIQPRVNLARLPDIVQEQFRLLWEEGKDATVVRVTDIKKLYAVSNDEFADYPDCDGPAFKAKWAEIMNPAPKAGKSESADKSKKADLTPSKASTISRGCSSPTVRRLLLALTGQGGEIGDLDATVSAAETDSKILADIALYLGADDYADLVNKSVEYGDSVRAAEAESTDDADVTEDADCSDEVAAS